MAKLKADLLNTLKNLTENEFNEFKWFLKQDDILEGFKGIPGDQLEKAERRDTVDLMVQKYQDPGALQVTMKILEMINRNDLVQHLQNSSSGPKENRDIKNMDTKGTSEKTMSNDRYTEYGDITKVDTTGASEETMRANPLHGTDEHLVGVEGSARLAERDQEEMSKYKDNIISVGEKLKVHPALIAAIISRQSQAGIQLRPDGFGQSNPNCFGLMQLNKDYHAVKDDPFGRDHLEQGIRVFIGLIKTMRMRKRNWSKEQQLKGALTCYITGILLEKYEDIESEFANDVVARAQWFAREGF